MNNLFVETALKKYKVYGDQGIKDVYFIMTEQDKKNFDNELVKMKHPLAYQPGTNEYRFITFVKSLINC